MRSEPGQSYRCRANNNQYPVFESCQKMYLMNKPRPTFINPPFMQQCLISPCRPCKSIPLCHLSRNESESWCRSIIIWTNGAWTEALLCCAVDAPCRNMDALQTNLDEAGGK